MSVEAMRFARDWIAEKPELRPCSAGKVVSMLTTAIAAAEKAEPVSSQHRFRHPQRGTGEWSPWQPCEVVDRPAWQLDTQGYEVEFRKLYAIQPDAAAMLAEKDALLMQALDAIESECGFGGTSTYDPRAICEAIRQNLGVKND